MTGENTSDESDAPRERMERAIRQIRREGWKAAVIEAAVDAVALFLAANLLISLFDPAWAPSRVVLPASVSEPLAGVLGTADAVAVPGSVLVAGGVGVAALVAGVGLRVRRPPVERFEAVNPPVAEALRTARDAVADGSDSRMATRLYADVLGRLRETSSLGLVSLRRVGATLLVVVALSAVTTQVAVHDVTLGDDGSVDAGGAENESVEFEGLRDGDAVLGEPGETDSGDENVSADVESTGGDEELDDPEEFPSTDADGDAAGGVESQQAGFERQEELEDAELIREYNVRIRESTED